MNDPAPINPKLIAERGEKIYNDKYRERYEKKHLGQFVVIEIASEKAYVADTPETALTEARKANPAGVFYLIKVGAPGAFRLSYSPGGALDWVLQ